MQYSYSGIVPDLQTKLVELKGLNTELEKEVKKRDEEIARLKELLINLENIQDNHRK